MSVDTSTKDDDFAAEYALRLLSGDDLRQAQRRLAEEPAFVRLVAQWEARFATIADEVAPEAPRPQLKRTLEARLFPTPAAQHPFWQKLWAWQTATALSLLLAAFAFFGDLNPQPTSGDTLYTAEIVSKEGDFRAVAVVDKSAKQVFITRTAGAAPAGRILQVWTHGPDEPAYSVGLWPEGDTVSLPMSKRMLAINGVLTLGISEEPPGGSPTGSPSGRVFGTVDIQGVKTSL